MNAKILLSEIAIKAILIALLIVPVCFNPQYGYYTFLRWFVCAAALPIIGLSIQKKHIAAVIGFVALLCLFNPLEKIYLSRDVWQATDIVAASGILISLIMNVISYRYEKNNAQ